MSKFAMAWNTRLARMGREWHAEMERRRPAWQVEDKPTAAYVDGPECVWCGSTRYDVPERAEVAGAYGRRMTVEIARCRACRRRARVA